MLRLRSPILRVSPFLEREIESLGLALSKLAVWSLANHLITRPNSPTHKMHIYFGIKWSIKSFPNLRVFDSLDSNVSLSQQISKQNVFAVKVTAVIYWSSVQYFIWIINNRFAQWVLGVPYMGVTPWCGWGDPPEGPPSTSSLLSPARQQKLWIPGTLMNIWKFGQNPLSDNVVSRTCWHYSMLSVSLRPSSLHTNSSHSPSTEILHILSLGDYVIVFWENLQKVAPLKGKPVTKTQWKLL